MRDVEENHEKKNGHMKHSPGFNMKGGEWYLEKRGSWKILPGSQILKACFDKSQSLAFAWFVLPFFFESMEPRAQIFTIHHP